MNVQDDVNDVAHDHVLARIPLEWKAERTSFRRYHGRFTVSHGKDRCIDRGPDCLYPARQETLGDGRKCSVMLTLREARLRRRMSQQSLADRAGVARVTVSQIELGKSGPRPHIARRIAEALDTAPSDIVEFRAAAESMRLPTPTILASLENDARNPA